MSTFTTIIQCSSGSPSYSNKRRKTNKRNPDWKRSKALTVCRWHDTVHRKPKRNYQKITSANQLIQQSFRYKVNAQKSLALLYTNYEKSEREIKESISFTTAK